MEVAGPGPADWAVVAWGAKVIDAMVLPTDNTDTRRDRSGKCTDSFDKRSDMLGRRLKADISAPVALT